MAELKAPPGAFLLVQLEDGVTPQQVTGIFHIIARLAGVVGICDLSTVSIELLNECILMRLSPDEQKLWSQTTRKRK